MSYYQNENQTRVLEKAILTREPGGYTKLRHAAHDEVNESSGCLFRMLDVFPKEKRLALLRAKSRDKKNILHMLVYAGFQQIHSILMLLPETDRLKALLEPIPGCDTEIFLNEMLWRFSRDRKAAEIALLNIFALLPPEDLISAYSEIWNESNESKETYELLSEHYPKLMSNVMMALLKNMQVEVFKRLYQSLYASVEEDAVDFLAGKEAYTDDEMELSISEVSDVAENQADAFVREIWCLVKTHVKPEDELVKRPYETALKAYYEAHPKPETKKRKATNQASFFQPMQTRSRSESNGPATRANKRKR